MLSINVFSFLTIKQDLDYFAKEMIFVATSSGSTIGDVDIRYNELVEEIGITPSVDWNTTYHDSSLKTVQLGETIKLTIGYNAYLQGFGTAKIPITLLAKHSGLSQRYWK
ncbi:DUF4320 family protein [Paludicola sp. MB14-C6]|uniref:DUF4320 family protein n=1 Tax=Paludihabitans sp. MB14-C6 TaxID=3070656 RepID=UPI0027DDF894|nr:DUF4320 family protein [Paludicola sp. MB14-C6]WMJ22878.1 DUF4320 family protein [Paludicola sp. MB14-C6]